MQPNAIFEPMGALAFLTFLVMCHIPVQRFRAAFKRQVSAKDFRYGESNRVPDWVSLPNRNFMNLLEAPILFYVVCLMYAVISRVSPASVGLA